MYHRGTVEGKGKVRVTLPEYWYKLVENANYTIQLTGWRGAHVSIWDKDEHGFTVQCDNLFKGSYKFEYTVLGSREELVTEETK